MLFNSVGYHLHHKMEKIITATCSLFINTPFDTALWPLYDYEWSLIPECMLCFCEWIKYRWLTVVGGGVHFHVRNLNFVILSLGGAHCSQHWEIFNLKDPQLMAERGHCSPYLFTKVCFNLQEMGPIPLCFFSWFCFPATRGHSSWKGTCRGLGTTLWHCADIWSGGFLSTCK